MSNKIPQNNPRAGCWEKQSGPEPYYCFIPAPLPPNPPVEFSPTLQGLGERASHALGRLDGVVTQLPNPALLLYTYVRKEAVLSSQIEGTQSSLSDLLLFENKQAPGVLVNDVKEVSNYVAALEYGMKRLKGGFPLSLRLMREIHTVLLKGSRGSDKLPGEFRRSQNWIGGSRPGNALYVPPPAHEVMPAIGALEKFIHGEPVQTPTLIKAGLVHAQFESIHPFLDGNGRLGRLLIPFILYAEGALTHPFLYLSLHFKENRQYYYETLQGVRTNGGWEEWLDFYLEGVEKVSNQACDTVEKLTHMFEQHRAKINEIGRAAESALALFELMKKRCLVSLPVVQKELKFTFPTANKALLNLEKLGFVKEITGKRRDRIFSYEPYLKILQSGTESAAG
ncbi:MAG: Fic family protein [Elusimicrobia bacterium]|nr:Fic family protein [Elusimicrobiota bacterium]